MSKAALRRSNEEPDSPITPTRPLKRIKQEVEQFIGDKNGQLNEFGGQISGVSGTNIMIIASGSSDVGISRERKIEEKVKEERVEVKTEEVEEDEDEAEDAQKAQTQSQEEENINDSKVKDEPDLETEETWALIEDIIASDDDDSQESKAAKAKEIKMKLEQQELEVKAKPKTVRKLTFKGEEKKHDSSLDNLVSWSTHCQDEDKRLNDSNDNSRSYNNKKMIPLEEQDFETQFSHLNDQVLDYLFDLLNVTEKLALERVCRRWQKIIRRLLSRQYGVGTTWGSSEEVDTWMCSSWSDEHNTRGGDIREAFIQSHIWMYDLSHEKSIENMKYLLPKLPNLRCLHLNFCILSTEMISLIRDSCKHLECLHLKSVVMDLQDEKPEATTSGTNGNANQVANSSISSIKTCHEIAIMIGSKIKHLSINPHYEHRISDSDFGQFLKYFNQLEELRIGQSFDREVIGKFFLSLPPTLKTFHSNGREFHEEGLDNLIKKCGASLNSLTFFTTQLLSTQLLQKIGTSFANLTRLRINLSYNELIVSGIPTPSPIGCLKFLERLSIDLSSQTDENVDDVVIWALKNGLPAIKHFELSKGCVGPKALSALAFYVPQLESLTLASVEIQCTCDGWKSANCDRFSCELCRSRGWESITSLGKLNELTLTQPYHRQVNVRRLHKTFVEYFHKFKALKKLTLSRYDVHSFNFLETLVHFVEQIPIRNKTQDRFNVLEEDRFVLKLYSVPLYLEEGKKYPRNLFIYQDTFML